MNEVSSTTETSKPTRVKDKKPRAPVVLPLLPPCKVCGDTASGVHYGAVACESCKAFFLRCLRRKRDMRCKADASCKIEERRDKSKCAMCRYERCLAAGMDQHTIRHGRHTVERKTKYILEAKAGDGVNKSPGSPLKVVGRAVAIHKESEIDMKSKQEDCERIIAHMTDTYRKNTDCTPEFLAGMAQREEEFYAKKQAERELFGELKPLSQEEYDEARRITGLDVDGREQLVIHMNEKAHRLASELISFAKALPEFQHIDIEDQASVVKNAARNGAYTIMTWKKYNIEKMLYHGVDGIWDKDTLKALYNDPMMDIMMDTIKRICRLGMSDEEMVMAAAVCMLLADQYELKERDKVDRCLDICLDCLRYQVNKEHPNNKFRLPELINTMTEIRSQTHLMSQLKAYETFNHEFNQLWKEIWE